MKKYLNVLFLLPLIPIVILLFPTIASAFPATFNTGKTVTVYTYGSGYIEYGVFMAVAGFVHSGGFAIITKLLAGVGILMISFKVLISGFKEVEPITFIKYILAITLLYSGLFLTTVNVHIQDTVINTPTNADVINNVPIGIAYPFSAFSVLQYDITADVEKWFSTPSTIDMTNAGMGLPLASQNLATGVVINNPYLFRSFDQYVINCIAPGLNQVGGVDPNILATAGHATGVASFLGYVAEYTDGAGKNLVTTEYDKNSPEGFTTTCGAQTKDIQSSMRIYVKTGVEPQMAAALGESSAVFSSLYGTVNASIYGMSNSATDEIMQMAAVNQYSKAIMAASAVAGVNTSAIAYGSALAQQNMTSSFLISGQLAGQYLPIIYGIIMALFVGFALVLLLLLFLPIGLSYLKMFFELLLFITVWPMLMAIYNYIYDLILIHGFQAVYGYASNPLTGGYSLTSAHSISQYVAMQLSVMGYLSWTVPMFAYALVSGSTYAMVSGISSIDSAGKASAAMGARTAATGDLSLGNDKIGNYSANDISATRSVATGNKPRNKWSGFNEMETTPTSVKDTDTATGAYAAVGKGSSAVKAAGDLMIDGSINKANVSTKTNAFAKAKSNARQAQHSVSSSRQTVEGSVKALDSADKTTVNKDWGSSNTANVSKAAEFAHLNKGQMTSSDGVSLSAFMEANAGLEAFGDGATAGTKLSLKHDFGMSEEQADTFTSRYQATQLQSLSNSLSKSHSTSIGKSSGFKKSINDSLTSMQNFSNAETKLNSAQTQLTAAKSMTSQETLKALPGFLTQYNKKHGITGTAAAKKDVQIEDEMGEGNKKYLTQFDKYLNNQSGIAKTQAKISQSAKGIGTKSINSNIPVTTYNKNKGDAKKYFTHIPMIKTPTAEQRRSSLGKGMINPNSLRNKAKNFGSLPHKIGNTISGLEKTISNLGKPTVSSVPPGNNMSRQIESELTGTPVDGSNPDKSI